MRLPYYASRDRPQGVREIVAAWKQAVAAGVGSGCPIPGWWRIGSGRVWLGACRCMPAWESRWRAARWASRAA